jgi:hypothetical protein
MRCVAGDADRHQGMRDREHVCVRGQHARMESGDPLGLSMPWAADTGHCMHRLPRIEKVSVRGHVVTR